MQILLSDTKDREEKYISQFIDSKNSSLFKIPSISYEDAGVYECVADNGIPPAIRTNFTLTIRGMDNFNEKYFFLRKWRKLFCIQCTD